MGNSKPSTFGKTYLDANLFEFETNLKTLYPFTTFGYCYFFASISSICFFFVRYGILFCGFRVRWWGESLFLTRKQGGFSLTQVGDANLWFLCFNRAWMRLKASRWLAEKILSRRNKWSIYWWANDGNWFKIPLCPTTRNLYQSTCGVLSARSLIVSILAEAPVAIGSEIPTFVSVILTSSAW